MMTDDDGKPIDEEILLDRIQAQGSLVVCRSTDDAQDLAAWRTGLRRRARRRGQRISVRRVADDMLVVFDPDYVVTEEQLRATVSAIPVPKSFQPRRLRAVPRRSRSSPVVYPGRKIHRVQGACRRVRRSR